MSNMQLTEQQQAMLDGNKIGDVYIADRGNDRVVRVDHANG